MFRRSTPKVSPPSGDDAAKHAAQRKMAGGAIKSLDELSAAASYAVYYFAASKDPFGTKPKKHKHVAPWAGMAGPRPPRQALGDRLVGAARFGAAPTTRFWIFKREHARPGETRSRYRR